tara:strand:+ start:322 stop:1182 length:861 start_codon:yes stop_codon:yes gene_type:complete
MKNKMVIFNATGFEYAYKVSDMVFMTNSQTDTTIIIGFKSTYHQYSGDAVHGLALTVTESYSVMLNILKAFTNSKSLFINIADVDKRITNVYSDFSRSSSLPALSYLTQANVGPSEYPGLGLRAASGFRFNSSISRIGNVVKTTMLVDITDLKSTSDNGDTIGNDTDGSSWLYHTGNGSVNTGGGFYGGSGTVTCLETPAGGDADIDLYEASDSTIAGETHIGSNTLILERGGSWAVGDVKVIAAGSTNKFIFMSAGSADGSGAGTYSAGVFLIELYGFANSAYDG